MKELKKILSICSFIVLFLLILYLNIGTAVLIFFKLSYSEFSYGLYFFGGLIFILYIIQKIINKSRIELKDLFIFLLILFGIVSYLFAYRRKDALFGVITRNEGLLSLISYYMIYLLASTMNIKSQKRLLNLFLCTGIFQVVIGMIQTLQITNVFGYDRSINWSVNFKFASGTLGNPNFYSTYILMCLLYAFGCLLEQKNIKFLLIFIFFVCGLIIGNTTSCIMSFVLWFLIVFCRKINRKNIKKYILITSFSLALIIFCLSFLDKFINNRISHTMNKNIEEIQQILDDGITDSTGNYRVYIWRETLNKIPKYYLTGIGIDNFSYINDGNYLCAGDKNYQCFDKAHNEYLQILICEGIFNFLIYVVLIIYTLVTQNRCIKGVYLAIYGYLFQAFFNISVIPVAPIFYMLLGFMCYKNNDLNKNEVEYE